MSVCVKQRERERERDRYHTATLSCIDESVKEVNHSLRGGIDVY